MRGLAAAALLALGLSACFGFDVRHRFASERRLKVEEAAEAYGEGLRWGRFEEAARWVHPERRLAFLAATTGTAPPVRYTAFQVESIELGPGRGQAEVLVSFAFYRLPGLQEQQGMERQSWRYERSARRWFIEPDLSLY